MSSMSSEKQEKCSFMIERAKMIELKHFRNYVGWKSLLSVMVITFILSHLWSSLAALCGMICSVLMIKNLQSGYNKDAKQYMFFHVIHAPASSVEELVDMIEQHLDDDCSKHIEFVDRILESPYYQTIDTLGLKSYDKFAVLL